MDAAAVTTVGGAGVGGTVRWESGSAKRPCSSDEQLLAAARRGDVAAYGELIRRHDPRCRILAARLLRDAPRTDDALQDAYCRAFMSLRRFRGDAGFGTWLYRIVYNACMDLHRKSARLAPLSEMVSDDLSAPLDDPAEIVERRQLLQAAIAGLSVEQRAAVVLVDQLGLDYETAAGVLGVTVGTIGSRLSVARAALRAALGAPLEKENWT